MNRRNDELALAALVREALPPVGETVPETDLWPRAQQRLAGGRPPVSGLDWLLAALAVGLLFGFPEALLLLLYHL